MDYKKITPASLSKIIISELCNESGVDNSDADYTRVVKIVETDGVKYLLCVKKKNIRDDSFVLHDKYVRHNSCKEYVDCSDSSSMEDVSVFEEVTYTYIYYDLDEKYNDIADSITRNDFISLSPDDIKNKKILDTVNLCIYIQKTIRDMDDMIKKHINK